MSENSSSSVEVKSLNERIAAIRAKAEAIGFKQPEPDSSPTSMFGNQGFVKFGKVPFGNFGNK